MGSDDLFKKRREERKQRKHEYRNPKANSFLIVTEGEKTEPLYFKGLQKLIREKIGGRIDVIDEPLVEVRGEGCATCKLIEKTEQIIKKANIIYQNVWVVFDKDEFEDFDSAIEEGEKKEYKIAWSNQSFEYWLYLHFYYSDAALHRDEWCNKLNDIFKDYHLGDGTYKKNYENIYELVNVFGGAATAIKHAKRRMAEFSGSGCKPSQYDPGTTVYQLVEELTGFLNDVNDQSQ